MDLLFYLLKFICVIQMELMEHLFQDGCCKQVLYVLVWLNWYSQHPYEVLEIDRIVHILSFELQFDIPQVSEVELRLSNVVEHFRLLSIRISVFNALSYKRE